MAVVKINAIEVPDGSGPELEKRFAARLGAVDSAPGFLGFDLLRPVAGETRYFVVTKWETDDHKISVSYEKCVECGACRIGCPYFNIEWRYPKGGFGVQYKNG